MNKQIKKLVIKSKESRKKYAHIIYRSHKELLIIINKIPTKIFNLKFSGQKSQLRFDVL